MQLHFNDQTPFTLVTGSCSNSEKSAECRIQQGNTQERFSVSIQGPTYATDYKPQVKLAFAMATKIANELFDFNISASDFSLPRGGHMVNLGEYCSWGDDAEKTKQRAAKDLKSNEIAGFEFYLRHALIAVENKTHKRKLVKERVPCL